MKNNDYKIRLERKEEQHIVEALVRDAFWNVYRPGCLEHYVLHIMRDNKDFIPELNFVMLKGDEIIGQNVFFRAHITTDNGEVPILTMGPISIAPKYERQGYGKILLDYTLEKAKAFGKAVCFEGNIDFYGKSGFFCASDFGIKYHGLPEGEDASFFLCKELEKGYLDDVTGVYQTPDVYMVSQDVVDEFDNEFPPKEKLVLPTQLF